MTFREETQPTPGESAEYLGHPAWKTRKGVTHIPGVSFLEVIHANHIAQPGLELLEPVVDRLSLHDSKACSSSRQYIHQFVGATYVQPCDGSVGLLYTCVSICSLSIEHREQYVLCKIIFQLIVETSRMQGCEQKPTYTTFRGSGQ